MVETKVKVLSLNLHCSFRCGLPCAQSHLLYNLLVSCYMAMPALKNHCWCLMDFTNYIKSYRTFSDSHQLRVHKTSKDLLYRCPSFSEFCKPFTKWITSRHPQLALHKLKFIINVECHLCYTNILTFIISAFVSFFSPKGTHYKNIIALPLPS